LYVPGFAGPRHAQLALQAARDLLHAVGYGSQRGAWLPVGVGLHTGVAFVGRFGEEESTTDVTALGDPVNLTARLASQAAGGEILATADLLNAAMASPDGLEERILTLKGKSEPVPVRVLTV
jgi:adenylate cyclase